jgi:hypothetical protein
MKTSSAGAAVARSSHGFITVSCTRAQPSPAAAHSASSSSSERWPLAPSGSTWMRASGGRAGTQAGFTIATTTMKSR